MQHLILNTTAGDVVISDCRNAISFVGKSRTDKQLSVMGDVTANTQHYAASKAGKVGKAAREGVAVNALQRAAVMAAKGNFTPLYEIIVLESVKCVQPIRNMTDYAMVRGFIKGMRDNLKNAGYSSSGKLTTEATSLDTILNLFTACDAAIEAQKAADAERRAAQAIATAAAVTA